MCTLRILSSFPFSPAERQQSKGSVSEFTKHVGEIKLDCLYSSMRFYAYE